MGTTGASAAMVPAMKACHSTAPHVTCQSPALAIYNCIIPSALLHGMIDMATLNRCSSIRLHICLTYAACCLVDGAGQLDGQAEVFLWVDLRRLCPQHTWMASCWFCATDSLIKSILFCRMMMCFSCMISTAARCSAQGNEPRELQCNDDRGGTSRKIEAATHRADRRRPR